MWLLPWEKLPPLILGPLLIIFSLLAFVIPSIWGKQESLGTGLLILAAGAAITWYGYIKLSKDSK